MSSPNTKNPAVAIVVGAVVLLVAYLLLPPVFVKILEYVYGHVDSVPANIQTTYHMIFAPTDWLAHNSETYDTLLQYEFRLLGL